MKKWYAIKTLSGKEKKAKENLESEIKLNNISKWIGDVILPLEKKVSLRNGKKYTRETLTIPGYLFIEAELIGEVTRIIRNTNMIIGFAGDVKNNPVAMRKTEVERMIGRMEDSNVTEDEIIFLVGEEVEIADGPFATFKGNITKVNKDKKTIDVNVSIFGRETPVTLNYLQVNRS